MPGQYAFMRPATHPKATNCAKLHLSGNGGRETGLSLSDLLLRNNPTSGWAMPIFNAFYYSGAETGRPMIQLDAADFTARWISRSTMRSSLCARTCVIGAVKKVGRQDLPQLNIWAPCSSAIVNAVAHPPRELLQ